MRLSERCLLLTRSRSLGGGVEECCDSETALKARNTSSCGATVDRRGIGQDSREQVRMTRRPIIE